MKKKILSLIIFLMILLVAIILIINFAPSSNSKKQLRKIVSDKFIDEENMIFPDNLYKFIAIYPEKSTETISNAFYYLACKALPKYYSECNSLSDVEIKEYYNKNKNTIFDELGYDNEEKFKNLVSVLKKLNGEELILKRYSIDENSIKQHIENYTMTLTIEYKNNNEINLVSKVTRNIKKNEMPVVFETE